MTQQDRDRWNQRYATAGNHDSAAAEVLTEYAYLLPRQGLALDLACGLGANALWLARAGLDTHAWDIADKAIERLATVAGHEGVKLTLAVRDVVSDPPAVNSFDVIVVSRFLDRGLAPALAAALKPAGLLYYQTFTRHKSHPGGPDNPAYLLADNELLHLFSPALRVRIYREENSLGDCSQGFRNSAMLIGEKTA